MNYIFKLMACLFIITISTDASLKADVLTGTQKDAILDQIQKGLTEYLSISSLSFTATVTHVKVGNIPIFESGKAPTGLFSYLYDHGNYLIEDKTPIKNEFYNSVAFDGKNYQRLDYSTMQLYVKKFDLAAPSPNDLPYPESYLRYSNPFLEPVEFLSQQLVKHDSYGVKLSELQNPSIWPLFFTRIKSVSQDKPGDPVIIDISAGKEWLTQKESFYRVTFDPEKAMFPVKIDRISSDGHLIFTYSVDDLKAIDKPDGTKIFMPLIATRMFFGGRQDHPFQTDPVYITKYEIKDIKLNPNISLDQFSIDPASAATILDANHNVVIDVPK